MKIFLTVAMILNLGLVCAEDKICKKDETCVVEGTKCEDPSKPIYKEGDKDIKVNGKPGMKCVVVAATQSEVKVCDQVNQGGRTAKPEIKAGGEAAKQEGTTGQGR